MNKVTYHDQRGLIRMIIVIVIAIVILSYYGFDLKEILTSDQVKENLGYVWDIIVNIWTNYLAKPFTYLWDIWVKYFWTAFINMLEQVTN